MVTSRTDPRPSSAVAPSPRSQVLQQDALTATQIWARQDRAAPPPASATTAASHSTPSCSWRPTASAEEAMARVATSGARMRGRVRRLTGGDSGDVGRGLAALAEPANALSLPTWAVHVSSVAEWVTAMALVWEYGERTGLKGWKGLSWGMYLYLWSVARFVCYIQDSDRGLVHFIRG